MEWNQYPNIKPIESKLYLVTIKKPHGAKDFLYFIYVAQFNAQSDQWLAYDELYDEHNNEPIKDAVIGWKELGGIYVG